MGLFDQIASQVTSQLSGTEEHSALLDGIMGLIDNQQSGGIAGLVQKFHDSGLGTIVSSWIGTGENQPISTEQIHNVLGGAQVQQMAAKLGFSPQQVSAGLAGLLPQVIDKLTPNGALPVGGALEQGLSLLKSKLFAG